MVGMLQKFGGGEKGKRHQTGSSTALSLESLSVVVALIASLRKGSAGLLNDI